MRNQKESLPLLLDLILTEKNYDDTNDSRLGYTEGQWCCRWPFWCKGGERSRTSSIGYADDAHGQGDVRSSEREASGRGADLAVVAAHPQF
ncbi:hypothetical protein PVK06_007549 [Gossypium arboreum]|uniref:Uncharacterized protein n=1 Tax=Gossypium arboreum TaxID=29729 RepID=A0ABR0QHM5_GOSAR|nr:hypothetical protein PVK06_007549 [Gossypium arboreum]